MFIEQKKKRNYRTFIYSAIIVVLCLLIVVIAWPAESESTEDELADNPADIHESASEQDLPVNNVAETNEDYEESNKDASEYDEENEQSGEYIINSNKDITPGVSTYYLVKRADGRIKVFFIDEQGNPIELETTEIIYEVLSDEDQRLFDEGYKVHSQEELAVLLQDFES